MAFLLLLFGALALANMAAVAQSYAQRDYMTALAGRDGELFRQKPLGWRQGPGRPSGAEHSDPPTWHDRGHGLPACFVGDLRTSIHLGGFKGLKLLHWFQDWVAPTQTTTVAAV